MSTIEALVHSSSAIFTLDLYSKFKKNLSDKGIIFTGRLVSTTILILAAALAPVVGKFPTIFEFFQKCLFFVAAPVAAVFITAVLWKRTTSTAAFWTLSSCLPLFIVPHILRTAEKNFGWQLNEFNIAGVVFAASLVFMVVTSLVTKRPRAEQAEGLVWRPSMARLSEDGLPVGYRWYKNLWLWCAIWVAVMVAIYIRFW